MKAIFIAMGIGILCLSSCSDSTISESTTIPSDLAVKVRSEVDRQDFVGLNSADRLNLWNSLDSTQQFLLWVDKLEQVLTYTFPDNQTAMIEDVLNFIAPSHFGMTKGQLQSETTLSGWVDHLEGTSSIFDEGRRNVIFGMLDDYSPSIEGQLTAMINSSSSISPHVHRHERMEGESLLTREATDCDCGCLCRWATLCSDKCCHEAGECKENRGGCGFLFLWPCKGLCQEEFFCLFNPEACCPDPN